MAVFNFDQVNEYVQNEGNGLSFLKLQDDGWQAKVRFMYGPGETFQGYSVHNVSGEQMKSKFIPCLREVGQPLDVCPLCKAGVPLQAQFFIPVFVISITKCINGVLQPEEAVNQVMIFQRGKTFQGSLASAVRQTGGSPLVNNVFNIVRNGKAKDPKTTYIVEFVNRDSTTLESLGERPQVFGSPILPDVKYEEMGQYLPQNTGMPQGVMPRTVAANPYAQPTQQTYQAPTQAPGIPF